MRKLIALLLKRQSRFPSSRWIILLMLTLGFTTGWKSVQATTPNTTNWQSAQASTPNNAPTELKNLLTQIESAASRGDVKAVMQFYSPNFRHGDGLNRQMMEQALTALWKRYPNLRYSTQLQSWQSQGNSIVADTVTKITGLPSSSSDNLALSTTITSRQRIAGGKIISQDILSERTQITSGTKPPQIDFKLPQQVKVGQQYTFDVIIQEPIGDDYILGAALQELVKPNKYLQPTSVDLELLSTGGLFKIGKAPATPGNQWISAVILRKEGMTMITQRMQVVKK